jgi:hypothetical protein
MHRESPVIPIVVSNPRLCKSGLLAELTVPGRLRSLSMGIMFAGQCLGGVLGFSISGPLVESAGYVCFSEGLELQDIVGRLPSTLQVVIRVLFGGWTLCHPYCRGGLPCQETK